MAESSSPQKEKKQIDFDKMLELLNPSTDKIEKKKLYIKHADEPKKHFNRGQFLTLKELVKKLPIWTEDNLEKLPVSKFVNVLGNLIKQQDDPGLRISASRALILLCKVLPSSSYAAVVKDFDGVNAFVKISTMFDDIKSEDEQQKYLQTLKKISQEHPAVCFKAGALQAVLQFRKASIGCKRLALSIVMNMCKELSTDTAKIVTSVVPLLSEYLKDRDAKVVELASICLTEIVKAFESFSHNLDEILRNHQLIKQEETVISPRNPGGGQASLDTSAWKALVLLLSTCAKSSHLGSKTLLVSGISVILKDLLTSSGVSPALSRPAEQIFEIVNLANELLPPLPLPLPEEQDDPIRTEISAHERFLKEDPKLLLKFGLDLLPVLIQICGSSVSSPISHKCLSVIAKLMYFSSADTIDSVLIGQCISSFLAGVLARKDPIVLDYSLHIAKFLMEKLPKKFSELFVREGVMQAVNALIIPGSPGTLPQPSSCHEESSKHSGLAVGLPPNPVEVSSSKLFMDRSLKASAFINAYGLTCVNDGSLDLQHLKNLCLKLTTVNDRRIKSDISDNKEEDASFLISGILKVLSDGDGVSTFGFIDSGVVDALLNYLSCGVSSKENIPESTMANYRKQVEIFITVALPSGLQDTKVAPMSILVEMLQKALSSLEQYFPLVLTHGARSVLSHGARSSSGNVHLSSGLPSLLQKLNLGLRKAEGEDSLIDYDCAVPFHPLDKVAHVEEFLWPQVQRDESGERLGRLIASPRLIFFAGHVVKLIEIHIPLHTKGQTAQLKRFQLKQ